MNAKHETFIFISEVISSHRITIPKRIREILDVEEGDMVKVEIKKVLKRGD